MFDSFFFNSVWVMVLLGLICGGILYLASRFFYVAEDKTVEELLKRLPGANCGACGFAGCSSYARALAQGRSVVGACKIVDEKNSAEIASLLGLGLGALEKSLARLLCQGGHGIVKKSLDYAGLNSCRAASFYFNGDKDCVYACLGYGDCVKVCPFDAIHLSDFGIPAIDQKKCVGCGLCVEECPKKLIKLMPRDSNFYVACSSHERGKRVSEVCKRGCIGCRRCEKACPENAITIEENLAVIDPRKCSSCGKCFEVCPTKSILKGS